LDKIDTKTIKNAIAENQNEADENKIQKSANDN
jgi:hypothetical protein